MTEFPSDHSPLGASGSYRWMECPGSVGLSQGCVDEGEDYTLLGSAAHELAETCLENQIPEAWVKVGEEMSNGIEVDNDMADAVQTYLDALVECGKPSGSEVMVEYKFHCPHIHKYFWGMSDYTLIDHDARTLHVWDYKNGAGIIIEVPHNPQIMYYACGVLESLDLWKAVDRVVLHIAQPRGFHYDGPIREWETTTKDLKTWLYDTLVPAMDHALVSHDTASGEHCRFCPVRGYACPQIIEDMDELEKLMDEIESKGADKLTGDQVGRFLNLFDVAKIIGKAAGRTAYARMEGGHKIPGRKLTKARSNREFKSGASAEAKKKWGSKAMSKPKLLTPTQMEKLPGGSDFNARWAFKPDKGLTAVREDDTRLAVEKSVKKLLKDQTKKGK